MLYLFILENSTNFYWIPEPTQSFHLHGKENSSKFWSFLQGSSTFFTVPHTVQCKHDL